MCDTAELAVNKKPGPGYYREYSIYLFLTKVLRNLDQHT